MELLPPALEVRCWTGRKDLLSVLPPLLLPSHAGGEEPAAAPPERGSPGTGPAGAQASARPAGRAGPGLEPEAWRDRASRMGKGLGKKWHR